MRNETVRKLIVARLREDLIGPGVSDEVLDDLPSDRYLTGILFPVRTDVGAEQNDDADTAEDEAGGTESIPSAFSFRPSTAGVSFAIKPDEEGVAGIVITVNTACYKRVEESSGKKAGAFQGVRWQRFALSAEFEEILIPADCDPQLLDKQGIPGLKLHLRVRELNDLMLVTAVLSNATEPADKQNRETAEENTFFQVSMRISAVQGASIVEKPANSFMSARDSEAKSAALIYRNVREYAVGHTCSAAWKLEDGQVSSVRTQWIPESVVKNSKASGDEIFDILIEQKAYSPLDTKWLSEADDDDLVAGLSQVPSLYDDWISAQTREAERLGSEYMEQATENIAICQDASDRIKSGIELLASNKEARNAFRLANRAIWLQNSWKASRNEKIAQNLVWRPFQLAFVLLALCSASDGKDDHRGTMDLLWFPTGGGKTEAYLLLTAYVIFLRRLRANGDIAGAGVTVFMRYTLRLLTIQQFQRAAALICACDLLRDGSAETATVAVPEHFSSDPPVSIGLWVGSDATPNKVEDAIENSKPDSKSSPAQLSRCPVCDNELNWNASADKKSFEVRCHNTDCDLGCRPSALPVWTVDEDIYRVLPSLMIGTIDKYAQLPRKAETGSLFGLGANVDPPDLIIQDELHLISGPLGTLAGIYEIAVDEMCAYNGARPKIIGSTATIRRADSQILALFERKSFQFPPPGIDHGNSGFATLDEQDPGRLYVGITSAGRSAKFALQAVAASLLQSAFSPDIDEELRDAYWTLVTYFNSLRELGGALVLMRDDVERSIEEYAGRRSESAREIQPSVELTGRVSSSEIPELLNRLELRRSEDDSVDTVLASNMISVGVDVSRLGLMIVNGQPKGIAEYIQATSRVGRAQVPGLVLTVYNAGKARDRSRYETFSNWHQSLYKDVEATSVTPFAPRARDRALHAAFVAMVRHLVPGMNFEPVNAAPYEEEIRKVINTIVCRARKIDPNEAEATETALSLFLENWIARGVIKHYWNDWGDSGLLMSAEAAATNAISGRSPNAAKPTPNTFRSVEPSTAFVLLSINSERESEK